MVGSINKNHAQPPCLLTGVLYLHFMQLQGKIAKRSHKMGLHRTYDCSRLSIVVTWKNCLKLCQILSLKQPTEMQNTQVIVLPHIHYSVYILHEKLQMSFVSLKEARGVQSSYSQFKRLYRACPFNCPRQTLCQLFIASFLQKMQ